MLPTNRQGLSTPMRSSSTSTSPARPQPPRLNTSTAITADGRQIEVIEISSGPSPQDAHPQHSQPLPAPETPQGRPVQQPLQAQPVTPSPFAATASAPHAPHSIFKPIKIHTAKCDVCNKHNKATLQRCIECGWQICTPCWDARGGSGAHGSTRKFTGAVYRSSDEEQPQKKPRKKGKNTGSGVKSAASDKGNPASKNDASLLTRPGQGNVSGKGASVTTLGNSTVNAYGSPSQAPTPAKSPDSTTEQPQGRSKIGDAKRQAPVSSTNSNDRLLRGTPVRRTQAPRTPAKSRPEIADDLSSSSSLTSLSVLEEDCGYGGDEEEDDDDATEIDPDSEDVIVANGKAYQKRSFRDLSPHAETRMNWLLIAAEEALQEREQHKARNKAPTAGPAPVPFQTRAQVPTTPTPIHTPASVPAPAPAPAPYQAPVRAPAPAPAPYQAPVRAPGQNPVRIPIRAPRALQAFAQPPAQVSSLVPPAVPISQLIPPAAVPMDIDQPGHTSNPAAPQHPRYGQLTTRKPFHQLDVPLGLRGIVPGIHMFRESKTARIQAREMRESQALSQDRMEIDEDPAEGGDIARTPKPHARAWEL
ncbi:hypothetical protein FQN49_002985 [Arthroderma sp. PD_2]|nr:hypothetical protein FQN49_002985 [Arthroderma sp. PD_2]